MDTETLDKLYLEWSQFTKCRTAREIAYRVGVARALKELNGGNRYQAMEVLQDLHRDWEQPQ